MKYLLFLFLLFSTPFFGQVKPQPKTPVQRDPFLQKKPDAKQPTEMINHVHSDQFGVSKDRYDGNPTFSGSVVFEHKGSTLYADEVVLYSEENFIKAYGNVKLVNADGSVITAQEMEYDGNTERGVARKNVVLTDPKQTIKTETLYYERQTNQAYFNTGGTITDAQNTMYTKSAVYNVSTKMINFTGDVRIDNPKYLVEGVNIIQNQSTNTATFTGPTTIYDKSNRANKIYTEEGTFNQNTNEVFLKKNSIVYYNAKKLTGNTIYFNRNTGYGNAKGDVTLDDPQENRYIKGGYGEVWERTDSAVITEKPYAVKIFSKDSMYFAAEKFITYQKLDSANPQKKMSFLRAFKKARMYKSNAQARADSLSFNETDGIMHLDGKPILWSGFKQVTGDKIEAYFNTQTENLDSLKVINNALAISKVDSLNNLDEFDQVKGKLMHVIFVNDEIKQANVIGNAQAITYADDVDAKTNTKSRIGINLATCGKIVADFEEKKIQIISCNIGSNGEMIPMSLASKEKRFFPDFNWNTTDRLKTWRDIFVESPNYPATIYESKNELFDQAQEKINKEKEKEEAKKPKRVRK